MATKRFRFLVEGNTGLVLQPKDASITKAGGVDMTEYDKLKLQNAYGCTACGGHQFSLTGGSFKATSSVPTTYCDWILRTGNNKQIVLDFSVMIFLPQKQL